MAAKAVGSQSRMSECEGGKEKPPLEERVFQRFWGLRGRKPSIYPLCFF